jgi:hypothetical protein
MTTSGCTPFLDEIYCGLAEATSPVERMYIEVSNLEAHAGVLKKAKADRLVIVDNGEWGAICVFPEAVKVLVVSLDPWANFSV